VVSLTLPIVDNFAPDIVLGFMTVVAAATSLLDVTTARAGLAKTGLVLLISTSRHENLFRWEQRPANGNSDPPYQPPPGALDYARVNYVFPPRPIEGQVDRHAAYK
jgi:osomolarity two-component system sensor histidine kinase SLN1